MLQKIKTKIPGFDELIEGGFPRNSITVLSGPPGTGKTIFSLQYIYNGASFEEDLGIYFTFEEKKVALIEQARQFGWDLEELEKNKKIKIIEIGNDEIDKNTAQEIVNIVRRNRATRIVIDSITTLSYIAPEDTFSIKKFLYGFISLFRDLKDTAVLFVSQKDEVESDLISKYLCDGVIEVSHESLGGLFSRTIFVRKMRRVNNNDEVHSFQISSKGLEINTE